MKLIFLTFNRGCGNRISIEKLLMNLVDALWLMVSGSIINDTEETPSIGVLYHCWPTWGCVPLEYPAPHLGDGKCSSALSQQGESELLEREGAREHMESLTWWYCFWCTADDLSVSVKKFKT